MSKESSYYIVIPAPVRYDERLSMTEKIILGELISLTNATGVCFAKNKMFADIYNLSERQVSHCISRLAELDYINIISNGNDRNIEINFKVVGRKLLPTQKKTSNLYINNTYNNTTNSSKEDLSLRTAVKKPLKDSPSMPRTFIVGVMTYYGNAQGWKDEDTKKAYQIFARICKQLFLLSDGNLQAVKNAIDWVKAQRYPSWTLNAVLKHWNDVKKGNKEDLLPEL